MKVLHFVLIAQHLTGDSKVVFFPSRLKAERFFQNAVTPLLEICERNNLEEDEAYSFGQTKDIVRFDSGYDEELDAKLGDSNHYYYVAEFSEWVDESTISFHNREDALVKYHDLVDDSIITLNNSPYHGGVNRYDNSTWESEDGTLFQETDNDDGSTDAFFGHTEVYYTYRIGKIELGI